jgi:hypothetical protein
MTTTDAKRDQLIAARAVGTANRIAAQGHPGVPLTPERVEKRERAFVIYRDFGKSRTIHKLHRVLSEEHPDLLASKVTLDRWSKLYHLTI